MFGLDAHIQSHSGDSSESFVQEGGRIEVLIKSLDGICIDNETNDRPSLPWVTATVAFSGSASDMEVGSSSVCGVTGQLIVESEPVMISSPDMLLSRKSPKLAAHWMEEKRNGTTQPHLTMPFSSFGKEGPVKSLQKGNRGAKFVKQGLEISQTSSTVSETTASSSSQQDTLDDPDEDEESQSRAGAWSDSGATMPEIIEMYVRLRHDEDGSETALWDGAAFLVVYGHEEDSGTHLLEIPIRKSSVDRRNASHSPSTISTSSLSSSRRNTRMRLSGDACLTIQVKVTPCRPTPSIPVASSIVASGSASCPEVVALSQSAMEAELEPLLQKLRQSERLAKKLCENQKRAMNVNVPTLSPDAPLPRPPPSYESFCYVPILSEWTSFWARIGSMNVNCDTVDADSVNRDENSTIATRDSNRMFPKPYM